MKLPAEPYITIRPDHALYVIDQILNLAKNKYGGEDRKYCAINDIQRQYQDMLEKDLVLCHIFPEPTITT